MDQPITSLLCDLVTLPSVNPGGDTAKTESPYGESRVAEYVEAYFRRYDVRTERQPVLPGRDNLLVHLPGRQAGAKSILLEAHMDTVDVEGMEAPFSAVLDGGRIRGRGACDTKASLAVMMMVLHLLIEEGISTPGGVCLAATVDEEYGETGVQRLLESAEGFSAAVVGEPTMLSVAPSTNGVIWFRILTHGVSAHASAPEGGVNAILAMADVMAALRARSSTVLSARRHPLCGSPNLTVCRIRGGSSENVVPNRCEITIDRRLMPGESWQAAFQETQTWIRQALGEGPARVEFEEPYHIEPSLEIPPDHKLVRALGAAAGDVLGETRLAGLPYTTHASFLAAAGIPSVVFGPGNVEQAHTVEEFVEVDQLVQAVEILKRFVTRFAESLWD